MGRFFLGALIEQLLLLMVMLKVVMKKKMMKMIMKKEMMKMMINRCGLLHGR